MIVTVKAPASGSQFAYGASSLGFEPNGTDDVPAYVAKSLVKKNGFTCGQDLSSLDVRAELAAAPAAELLYYVMAFGKAPHVKGETEEDFRARALALFDRYGEF